MKAWLKVSTNKQSCDCWRRKNTRVLVGSQIPTLKNLLGLRSFRRWLGSVHLDGFPLVQAEELFRVPLRAYLEILARLLQALLQVNGRLPVVEVLLRLADIRLASARIVGRQRAVLDRHTRAHGRLYFLCELRHAVLAGIAKVDRTLFIVVHQSYQSLDEVGDEAEASCLGSITTASRAPCEELAR